MLEPAGALSVAGAKKYLSDTGESGGSYVSVLSGANMKFDRLRFVAERALVGQKREALFSVAIPERPGAFKELYQSVFPRAVTEFTYRYSANSKANIFMSVEISDGEDEITLLTDGMTSKGFHVCDISNNEMAKSHARYLTGGRAITAEGFQSERCAPWSPFYAGNLAIILTFSYLFLPARIDYFVSISQNGQVYHSL